MTKIKLCGLTRDCDIQTVNQLLPEYIGFVFAKKSRRCVSPERALELKKQLHPAIKAVGVFVNETPENVADYLTHGIIDLAQLHGKEDEAYIARLRQLTDKPLIKAFRIDREEDIAKAFQSSADYILLDSGDGGTGTTFNWEFLDSYRKAAAKMDQSEQMTGDIAQENEAQGNEMQKKRSSAPRLFLAGGLTISNVASAIAQLHPYAVDVSSGIETDGLKDPTKMQQFVERARLE